MNIPRQDAERALLMSHKSGFASGVWLGYKRGFLHGALTIALATVALLYFTGCAATPKPPPTPAVVCPDCPPSAPCPTPSPCETTLPKPVEVERGAATIPPSCVPPTIHFALDSARLSLDAAQLLDRYGECLKRAGGPVAIDGHACELGTAEHNMALSLERAHAVRGYLTALGIDPDRLFVRPWGEEQPTGRGLEHDRRATLR